MLSPGVRVHSYATVEDAVLMHGVRGRARARSCAVPSSTRTCQVPPGARIGVDPDWDRQHFHVSENGVVVIGKGDTVPAP